MTLEFVNHASVLFKSGDVALISDPWIEGKVFQDGWAHLSKSKFTFQDFARVTHIWFSHEHPDHFFPPNIKAIPPEIRKNITVLYPKTEDRKVVEFCRKLQFKAVIELEPAREYELGSDFKVISGSVKDDSYLLIQTPGFKALNTNDCVLNTAADVEKIKAVTGEVDLLLTQFSYACWAGNADEPEERRKLVEGTKRKMRLQVEHLRPKFCMPMASFIWFCHEENFYMNDEVHRVDEAADFLRSIGTVPIVLYPGDTWKYGAPHDNASAIARYLKDAEEVVRLEHTSRTNPTTFEDVHASATEFSQRVRRTSPVAVAYLACYPLRAYLTDLNETVQYSVLTGLKRTKLPPEQAQVRLSSEVLRFCFKNNWAFDTTHINGRFQRNGRRAMKTFHAYMTATHDMNHGHPLAATLSRALVRKLKRLASRGTKP